MLALWRFSRPVAAPLCSKYVALVFIVRVHSSTNAGGFLSLSKAGTNERSLAAAYNAAKVIHGDVIAAARPPLGAKAAAAVGWHGAQPRPQPEQQGEQPSSSPVLRTTTPPTPPSHCGECRTEGADNKNRRPQRQRPEKCSLLSLSLLPLPSTMTA